MKKRDNMEIKSQTVQEIPKDKKFFQHSKKYKGFPMKQADDAPKVFKKFFSEQKFDRIIELGTGVGGFTLCLSDFFDNEIHTFDNIDKMNKNYPHTSREKLIGLKTKLKKAGVSINIEDVFETDSVEKLIKKQGRVLLLCDNGDKVKEVHLFGNMLKLNDVIMAHDYFPNVEKYYAQNIWMCCAFTDSDVYNDTLKPYYAKEFESVFWLSRIKGE